MLERQRRARINASLDQLKEILITGLQSEGENVARLEKADILELTVRHLHKLQQQVLATPPPTTTADNSASSFHNLGEDEKFRTGFSTCAKEVSRLLATAVPKIDIQVGTNLMIHLGHALNQLTHTKGQQHQFIVRNSTGPISPAPTVLLTSNSPLPSPSSTSTTESYRPYTPPYSPPEEEETCLYSPTGVMKQKSMWRPW